MLALSSALSSAQHNISHLLQTHYNHYSEPFTQLDTQEKVMVLLPAALSGLSRWIAPAAATASLATGVFILILFTESYDMARLIAHEKKEDITAYQERKNRELFVTQFVKKCFKAFIWTTIPTLLCASLFTYFRTFAERSICLFVLHEALRNSPKEELYQLLLISFIIGKIFSLMLPFSITTCTAVALAINVVNHALFPPREAPENENNTVAAQLPGGLANNTTTDLPPSSSSANGGPSTVVDGEA